MGIVHSLKPHYLIGLLIISGLVVGMINASQANTQASSSGGNMAGSPGPGAMAVVQEALAASFLLEPSVNDYLIHYDTTFDVATQVPNNAYKDEYTNAVQKILTDFNNNNVLAGDNEVQCAEFVWNVYEAAGHTLPTANLPVAEDYWDYFSNHATYQFQPGSVGTTKPNFNSSQWKETLNGNGLPSPGDIIVWGGGESANLYPRGGDPTDFQSVDGVGHVAIVISVQAPQGNTPGSVVVAQANGQENVTMPDSSVRIVGTNAEPGTQLYKMPINANLKINTDYIGEYVIGFIHNTTQPFQAKLVSTTSQTSAGNSAGIDPGLPANLPTDSQSQQYIQLAEQDASKYGINPNLFVRQIMQESGFNPWAISSVGAEGIAQFMPARAASEGFDPWDPVTSLQYAARDDSIVYKGYLASYSSQMAYEMTFAAYNAGSGAVNTALNASRANYQGDTSYWFDYLPYETQNYVSAIMNLSI